MRKRLVGIFICMLLLTLPTIQGANNTFDKKAPLTKTNDNFYFAFGFNLIYGIIEYNGEELREYLGNCYNVTPIKVRYIIIGYESGLLFESYKITTDVVPYLYIPKDIVDCHGFVSKHVIFLHVFEWVIEN